ncbi:hypothetical protein, partial [Klebsiella pneumoniae]|uniref:hypothetical protein n=1 Tax=Klebsiella pneumoniae TaxID=573 RepID=UPI003B5C0AEA
MADSQSRNRGTATITFGGSVAAAYLWNYSATLYKWRSQEKLSGWDAYWYLSRWQTVWRQATDNDRPVEPGGFVTAEGRRYRIPGMEGYLMPT